MKQAMSFMTLEGAELSLLFVNDSKMQAINKEFRGVDSPTDVLSFPIYGSAKDVPRSGYFLLGDIVVNLDRAQRQTTDNLDNEVLRLLIHGLLHLIGYDHEVSAYKARKMASAERELFDALTQIAR
ncbi:MAG: rRNA maturation RNase YbeY [Candidatus Magnetobacterium sp. LHC-1]|uniref:Endoribonuclease YbeY n=1 Tax=Candidatus Magnetobacterium casense TaxID=1455061 RepID=A0ABS6S132_9BACT|nr:rRNA maturation RNase YbeY [Candidatus Magnetobacterium casensis]MBF0608758.1 rRNA maturation RNase YbeY [Nitrospirota bacterium]MBV6342555.1 rRNA maturation RNase YbeY [Candidatus Magnetobacterium casensis]